MKMINKITSPPSLINRVRIWRYCIAKCDTISTNCYAFAQNASLKSVTLCFLWKWMSNGTFNVSKEQLLIHVFKPKSSNFEAEKFVQLQLRLMMLHQNIAGKTPTTMHLFWVNVFTIPTPCNSYEHALHCMYYRHRRA